MLQVVGINLHFGQRRRWYYVDVATVCNNIVLVTCTNFCCFFAQISGYSSFVRSLANYFLVYEYENSQKTQKFTKWFNFVKGKVWSSQRKTKLVCLCFCFDSQHLRGTGRFDTRFSNMIGWWMMNVSVWISMFSTFSKTETVEKKKAKK